MDEIGQEPLLYFVNTVRKLYSGNSTDISSVTNLDEKKKHGLTAAIAFLHSRGLFLNCVSSSTLMLCVVGVGALFGFDIEGDVGVDPNDMVLWFSQPRLGLPSKVNIYLSMSIQVLKAP